MSIVPDTSVNSRPFSTVARLQTGSPAEGSATAVLISPTFALTAQHALTFGPGGIPKADLVSFGVTAGGSQPVHSAVSSGSFYYPRGKSPTTISDVDTRDLVLFSLERNAMLSTAAPPADNLDGMAFFADSRDLALSQQRGAVQNFSYGDGLSVGRWFETGRS
jgi:V8-like Glu-specific endopeptidase